MAEYRIVCAQRLAAHSHITHVGVGDDSSRATNRLTVQDVRRQIGAGDSFFTLSPSTGKRAGVKPYDVSVAGRIVETIRSSEDAIRDNNLDYIRVCNYAAGA